MKIFRVFVFLFVLFASFNLAFSQVYNEKGDFAVVFETQKQNVFNDDINAQFSFIVKNNQDVKQFFKIDVANKKGWDIDSNFDSFNLEKGAEKQINVKFKANSDFDYSTDVVSPDEIKISQIEEYKGYFLFPIVIVGKEENVSLKFEVEVDKREKEPVIYNVKFSSDKLSPISPMGYSIEVVNLDVEQNVEVKVELGNDIILDKFDVVFSPETTFKVFQNEIRSEIAPGKYGGKVTVRLPVEGSNMVSEWSGEGNFVVEVYENLVEDSRIEKSFFKDVYIIDLDNQGNVRSSFQKDVEFGFFKRLLFFSELDNIYVKEDGVYKYEVQLERGENFQIVYGINYIPVYVIVLVILVLVAYVYLREKSNPLDVETEVYGVRKDTHEGVKSFKVRIGFENIRDYEIERIRVLFKMPSYLSVKDSSFLLSEPNQVLKGGNKYKLIWNFKKFGKNDSRVLGFTLENKKGILGDIRLSRLEVEVTVRGSSRKYWKSFPVIEG